MKSVPIPDCYAPPPRIEDKRVRLRVQLEAVKAGKSPVCDCGETIPLWRAYKCLYCGEWFCLACGERHFGMTRAEWNASKEGQDTITGGTPVSRS